MLVRPPGIELPPDGKDALLSLLQEIKTQRHGLTYRPYPKQLEFHAAEVGHREIALIAANQCITPWTWLQRPGSMALAGEAFFSADEPVLAWSDGSERVARTGGGCVKGIEPAFRLVMDTGLFVDCSTNHQILTERGYLRIGQLASLSSGLRWTQRAEDFQASCVGSGYLRDPRLPFREDSDLARLLSQADAPTHSLCWSKEDAAARIFPHTSLWSGFDRPTTAADALRRLWGLFGRFAGPATDTAALSLTDEHRDRLRFAAEAFARLRRDGGPGRPDAVIDGLPQSWGVCLAAQDSSAPRMPTGPALPLSPSAHAPASSIAGSRHDAAHTAIFYPFEGPALVGGARIVAFVPLGYQPIVDVSVPGPNNYKAGGAYHHNSGKSVAGANAVKNHLTGVYPEGWPGRRFTRPIVAWVASTSGGATRDNAQRLLLGRIPSIGAGIIPANRIASYRMKSGTPGAIDSATIRHVSGGISHLLFKSYEQGRANWQGDTIDVLWCDEEAPEDIYDEGITRTFALHGLVINTFTPLLGMTNVVRRFYPTPNSETRHITSMTLDDVTHYSEKDKAEIIASWPEHMREARAKGKPLLGDGGVFPIARSRFTTQAFPIPDHFKRIGGIDFGWDHPFGYVHLAIDPDSGIKYVTDCFKVRTQLPLQHVDAIKLRLGRGPKTPIAWPHDGHQTQKNTGKAMILEYSSRNLNTLEKHATYQDTNGGDDGGYHVEPGVQMMLQELQQGTMKVFDHLEPLLMEVENYHRKAGKIVDEDDDLISAWRYAYMMRRKAEPLIVRPPSWSEGRVGSLAADSPSWQAG